MKQFIVIYADIYYYDEPRLNHVPVQAESAEQALAIVSGTISEQCSFGYQKMIIGDYEKSGGVLVFDVSPVLTIPKEGLKHETN